MEREKKREKKKVAGLNAEAEMVVHFHSISTQKRSGMEGELVGGWI
jgi:hypothetical protein